MSPSNGPLNILLVEDNCDDVFFFQNAFEKAGGSGSLHVACDGIEAVEYLSGQGSYANRAVHPFPDILFLDLNMPRMNGFEVLEWVRHNPKCSRLIVYVLTSSCRDADVDRAYDLGANGYVVKPTRVDQLVDLVKALQEWHRFLWLPRTQPCEKAEPEPVA